MNLLASRILGTVRGLPPKVLTNQDLSRMVGTSDEWKVERTGVREGHNLEDGLAASDTATEEGRRAGAERPAWNHERRGRGRRGSRRGRRRRKGSGRLRTSPPRA